jgi:hypothetical protein
MNEFRQYTGYLEQLISTTHKDASNWALEVSKALDGSPSTEFRQSVPIEKAKASGAFFTDSLLTEFALSEFSNSFDKNSIIFDPACGTGNLLLYCASKLPFQKSFETTIADWGGKLIGHDIFNEFISVTKSRLILYAMTNFISPLDNFEIPSEKFPNIFQASSLDNNSLYSQATHIVLNPPYTFVDSPEGISWASGKINAASIFVENCVKYSRVGTKVIAILPDVLRSGSRYQKWREMINQNCTISRIELYGQFNQWADVDVFILELEITKQPNQSNVSWFKVHSHQSQSVGDLFDVHVGPVVDYRDPHKGRWYSFVISKELPHWKSISTTQKKRRFLGRTFNSPLVVIRRTSRESDKYRAIGTLVNIDQSVAIENHLLVLIPKDGKLITCKKLLKVLAMEETNKWLNQRIRCRHLTVSSIKKLPWWIT